MRRIGQRSKWAAIALGLLAPLATPGRALAQQDSWDAVFLSGSKVGHMHTTVEPLQERGRKLVRVRVNFNLSFKRGKDTATMELEYGTIETPEGEVLRLDTRTHASQQVMRVHGDVVDGKMTLKIDGGNQRQQEVIPWGPEVRGPYGPEQSFSRSPMKPGEVRKLKTFVPDLNKVAEATLTARAVEPIALGGGVNRDVLRVDQELTALDGKKMPEMSQTFWVDSAGQVLKTHNDAFGGMVTYRTTKEGALKPPAEGQQFDLIQGLVVKIGRKITRPEESRSVVYKVTMPEADPGQFFPNDRRQSTKPGPDSHSAILEVKTAGPDDGPAGPETVGPEFLRSNPLVNSDDAGVIALSRRAIGAASAPWAKARAINKWVAVNMKDKNFSTSFAAADEVARTLSGDCTEHGVLTAAMCRAQGIPARVVVGLVYATSLGGFGFHMWNEVYVNRRWVAIDSAFDQDAVDAVHLKLSDTSLDGVSPFETFTSVVRVANKLKLEAVEVR